MPLVSELGKYVLASVAASSGLGRISLRAWWHELKTGRKCNLPCFSTIRLLSFFTQMISCRSSSSLWYRLKRMAVNIIPDFVQFSIFQSNGSIVKDSALLILTLIMARLKLHATVTPYVL